MHFRSIQLLRAFAAVYVVLYHVNYFWNNTGGFLSHLFDGGYAAVDLFFVISGFVIAQSLDEYNNGFKESLRFLAMRYLRIYLFYWIIFLLFYITALVDLDFSFKNLIKTILLLPGHIPVIITSWTLPYELYFYLLLSLYVLQKRFIYLLIIVFILSSAAFINLLLAPSHTLLPVLGFYNEFVLEFFLGLFAKKVYYRMSANTSVISLVAGLILFFLLPVYHLSSHIIMCGLPAFFTLAGLTNLEHKKKIRIPAFLVLLGDSSYMLYLIHSPVVLKVLSFSDGSKARIPFILITVVLTIIFSIIIHVYFEKRILNWLKKFINYRLKPGSSLIKK